MNRKQAGIFAVGALVVAIAIIVVGAVVDRAGQSPAGEQMVSSSGGGAAQTSKPGNGAEAKNSEATTKTEAGAAGEGKNAESGAAPSEAQESAGTPATGGPAQGGGQTATSTEQSATHGDNLQSASIGPSAGQAAAGGDNAAGEADNAPAQSAASKPGLPSFDVLRVEPDGSTVIAGRAEPGSEVEIMDKNKPLLSTTAGESGSFVAVFDKPLAPGDYQLTLKATGKDGKTRTSAEVATVSVPKDHEGKDLLALISKPGEASRIISEPQGKSAPAAAGQGQMEASEAAGPTGQGAGAQAEVADLTPSQAANAGSAPAAIEGVRLGTPEADKQARAKVHIDAVEIEDGGIYIAGSAPRGATVRVYADDKYVGKDKATVKGHFVVNGKLALAPGHHDVRVDLIDPDTGKVTMRATVPFDRPSGGRYAAVSPQIADAGNETSPSAAKAAPVSPEIAKLEKAARDSMADLKKKIGAATPDAGEIDAARKKAEQDLDALVRKSAEAGSSEGETEAAIGASAGEALKLVKSLPRLNGAPSFDATQMQAMRDKMDEAGKKLAEAPSVTGGGAGGPTTVVQPALTSSDNFVIIRRGDTLWQISRRTYGRGIRYTTIYLANSDQIANPNLILPGQIFDVPDKPEKSITQALELHHELQQKDGRKP